MDWDCHYEFMGAEVSSVILKEDELYVYTDKCTVAPINVGIDISHYDMSHFLVTDTGNYHEKQIKIVYPSNCKNCGAILNNNICEYCGSDNGEYKEY